MLRGKLEYIYSEQIIVLTHHRVSKIGIFQLLLCVQLLFRTEHYLNMIMKKREANQQHHHQWIIVQSGKSYDIQLYIRFYVQYIIKYYCKANYNYLLRRELKAWFVIAPSSIIIDINRPPDWFPSDDGDDDERNVVGVCATNRWWWLRGPITSRRVNYTRHSHQQRWQIPTL
jgi:hypothetical protein